MPFPPVNHLRASNKTMLTTDFWVTLSFLTAGAAIVALMMRLERQPKTKLEPSLLPTTFIMLIGGLIALMALFHLVDVLKPVAGH
jgi:hypothetical protein